MKDTLRSIGSVVLITAYIIAAAISVGILVDHIATRSSILKGVAFYENGKLTDEDGNVYAVDFGVPDGRYIVSYDSNGTVTRTDDTPVRVEALP